MLEPTSGKLEVIARRRAVFLDRDGVVNHTCDRDGISVPPPNVESVRLIDGVIDACAQLRRAGLLLIIVTNQPDIARGTQLQHVVDAINHRVATAISADDTFCCPHDTADGCFCRKPQPGMVLEAAARWNIDLRQSAMVGDRPTDIQAGIHAGCMTVLVGMSTPKREDSTPDARFPNLYAATPWLIQHTREERNGQRQ